MAHKTLRLLTTAALALPAIAQAQAVEESQVDYQFSFYEENDDRMTVKAHQTRVNTTIKDFRLKVDLIRDIVTGASPMFTMPSSNGDGKVVQVLSGASIKEQRDVANLGLSTTVKDWDIGLNTGVSSENDYLSHSAAIELGHDFNQKNTRLNLGVGMSFDDVGQTGSDLAESKRSDSYALGISQLLDAKSIVTFNLGYGYHRGYLTDPYKKVFFNAGGLRNEQRPDKRRQWTSQLGYQRHLNDSVALQLDYRFYHDSWQINAHTLEIGTPIQLAHDWVLRPSVRYYKQSAADFYQAYFEKTDTPQYYSSDYRLSDFSAISPELRLEKQFNDSLNFNLSWRYYRSNSDLDKDLNFNLFSLGVSAQF